MTYPTPDPTPTRKDHPMMLSDYLDRLTTYTATAIPASTTIAATFTDYGYEAGELADCPAYDPDRPDDHGEADHDKDCAVYDVIASGWVDVGNPFGGFTSEDFDESLAAVGIGIGEAVDMLADFDGAVWDAPGFDSVDPSTNPYTGESREATAHVIADPDRRGYDPAEDPADRSARMSRDTDHRADVLAVFGFVEACRAGDDFARLSCARSGRTVSGFVDSFGENAYVLAVVDVFDPPTFLVFADDEAEAVEVFADYCLESTAYGFDIFDEDHGADVRCWTLHGYAAPTSPKLTGFDD